MLITPEWRQLVRAKSTEVGATSYRILPDSEVSFYGAIPNTNKVGWYFVGYLKEVVNQILRENGQEIYHERQRHQA